MNAPFLNAMAELQASVKREHQRKLLRERLAEYEQRNNAVIDFVERMKASGELRRPVVQDTPCGDELQWDYERCGVTPNQEWGE